MSKILERVRRLTATDGVVGPIRMAAVATLHLMACNIDVTVSGSSGSGPSEATSATATDSAGATGGTNGMSSTSVGPTTSSSTTLDSTTTLGTTDDSSGGTETEGCESLDCSDMGDVSSPCGLFEQDCPEGEQCVPHTDNGGNAPNTTTCVPVGEGELGDPCETSEDCSEGNFCWENSEEGQNCMEICKGTVQDPECSQENAYCSIGADLVLAVCIEYCDPLNPNCEEGQSCLVNSYGNFRCLTKDDILPIGELCDPLKSEMCQEGAACLDQEYYPCDLEQPDVGCCAPLCNKNAEPSDCDEGFTCVSWQEDACYPTMECHPDLGACVTQP